jgi:hypothetical protein
METGVEWFKRIEPFMGIPYLVTDNRCRCGTDAKLAFWEMFKPSQETFRETRATTKGSYSKKGDKRVTGSGISSKQDGDTRHAWGVASSGPSKKINLIENGRLCCDN